MGWMERLYAQETGQWPATPTAPAQPAPTQTSQVAA